MTDPRKILNYFKNNKKSVVNCIGRNWAENWESHGKIGRVGMCFCHFISLPKYVKELYRKSRQKLSKKCKRRFYKNDKQQKIAVPEKIFIPLKYH